jgi:hypothetical protein
MPLQIRAALHLNDCSRLTCTVTNTSNRDLAIREPNPDFDLTIAMTDGTEAIPQITSYFGAKTHRRMLAIDQSICCEIDLLDHYLFPVAGPYRIAVAYDSKRQTSRFDPLDDLDTVVAFSDSISFTIARDQVRLPAEPDPIAVTNARAYLERLRNKRWWQFWIT